ncbi:MAG: imidazole glycerol phosphate synthase subunit HisH [Spirochaetaceae bacterium]|nr:imidazole glycerol phosphate synthase subunit HisH [Spirochaetaceae bacterium]MCF7948677.1 imidazole glycerol phosphate synthase subunit HisH [Spirochaetia bacterium]MCF7951701.1 imidazole glycerol phosphate synthase subunit HisH [Spirochaetaceae bacterium]
MKRVGVVDYDAGNLTSVTTALKFLEADYIISSRPEELEETEQLIFPGVGEARTAMQNLRSRGLDQFMRDYFQSGRQMLGICLGSQIVLSKSEEHNTECLDIVPGTARRFSRSSRLKVPHMGWNQVQPVRSSPLFADIPGGISFYFVHSYYPEPQADSAVLATTEYGITFTSALQLDNLHAVQFHPEKSGKWGLKLLQNFLNF